MNNDRFVSALNEVFEAKNEAYMKSVEDKSDHVFSERFNKKIRRIIRTKSNPLRLFYIERRVLINTLSVLAVIGIIAFIGVLNYINYGQHGDGGTYIDIDSNYSVTDSALAEQLKEKAKPLNTVVTDYKQDSMSGYDWVTFDDNYMYIDDLLGFQGGVYEDQKIQCYTVNLQTGEMVSMCDVPGCTHDSNQFPDCINHRGFYYTAVGDAMWGISDNKLTEDKNGVQKVIFENTYCTEFEENYDQENDIDKYRIYDFYVDDDYIYIFGRSFTYRIDRKTMKAQEPINITDDAAVLDPAFYNGKVYIGDALQEFFEIDYDAGTATKIVDRIPDVYRVQVYNDRMYYTRWEETQPRPELEDFSVGGPTYDWDAYREADFQYMDTVNYRLYSRSLDGTGEKLELENCAFFEIIDGMIYYWGDRSDDRHILKCYNIETGDDRVIYDNWAYVCRIYTAEHIDRIFVSGFEFVSNKEGQVYHPSTNQDVVNSKLISFRRDGSDLWAVTVDGSDTIV